MYVDDMSLEEAEAMAEKLESRIAKRPPAPAPGSRTIGISMMSTAASRSWTRRPGDDCRRVDQVWRAKYIGCGSRAVADEGLAILTTGAGRSGTSWTMPWPYTARGPALNAPQVANTTATTRLLWSPDAARQGSWRD
jgi:hypothetical protein